MSLNDIHLDPPKRLGHLPLIMDIFRRSRIAEVIDEACGIDRRMKVSHGECVAMIIAGVFAGEHGLWRLQDRLNVYDMATVMQDAGINLDEYHDVRLGRALDAIYDAGPDRILSALSLEAIRAHDLGTDFLHIDTTTLSFYGAYENEDDAFWNPEIAGDLVIDDVPERHPRVNVSNNGDGRSSPMVVRGYAKNKRHDLKQILYGSVVTRDGGVPLYGRAMDGNTSDITAASEFLDFLRTQIGDVSHACFVADCKGWNPRVLDQVREHQLRILSRLPRGTNLANECLELFDIDAAPCCLKHYSHRRKHWSWVAYQGRDAEYAFHRKIADENDDTVEKVVLPVRVVTCFSSQLYRQKARTVTDIRKRETKNLATKQRELERRSWRCRDDALLAAEKLLKRQPFVTFTATIEIYEESITPKRGKRGRPKKGEQSPPSIQQFRHRVRFTKADDDCIDQRIRQDATYVLIRNQVPGWDISDEEMAAAYGEQWRVEHGFAWLKSQAAINPMYLESPRRIEALCLLYHIALMLHTLVQRAVRAGLKRNGWTLPYHRNKPSDNITAKFLYELYRNVTSQVVSYDGDVDKRLFGTDEHTDLASRALGLSSNAYRAVLHDREK